jgi:hypothetical protein
MAEGTPWFARIIRTRRQMCESPARNSKRLAASRRGKKGDEREGIDGLL